jgi:hypothetical protein
LSFGKTILGQMIRHDVEEDVVEVGSLAPGLLAAKSERFQHS